MAKIQLTLSTGYVPNWGAWEGVREVMQNAMDAQDDGFEMEVRHNGVDTLRVSSRDVKLDANVWLLGTSSKGSGKYRGHFGEGLKLGVLALVRANHDVKIINDDESWSPKIEESEVFGGADVLTIYTRSRASQARRFTVEIGGIDKATWDDLKPRFLHLAKPKNMIHTTRGDVILDRSFKGKVFVKGIFVQTNHSLAAGYNFSDVDTDRDRKMVDSWDLHHHAAKAWEEAMTQRPTPKITSRVIKMLAAGDPDVKEMGSMYGTVNPEVAEAVTTHFKKLHGPDFVPVTSMAESREAKHLGKKGVVVPSSLAKVLEAEIGSLAKAKEAHKQATSKTYAWDGLTKAEQAMYTRVMELVEPAAESLGYAPIETRLTVVDFNDEKTLGQHRDEGKILIAKKILTDFEELLSTVVHEASHDKGGDGHVEHERGVEALFSRIIAQGIK
jgi:hypothetical protein